jgi:hypothetical protein
MTSGGGGTDNEWLRDAVDNTFLVDGVTSLRAYVRARLLLLPAAAAGTTTASKSHKNKITRINTSDNDGVSESEGVEERESSSRRQLEQVLAGTQLVLVGGNMTLLEFITQDTSKTE